MPLAHDAAKPLYEQIRDLILDDIRAGRYAVHQRLPSERELSVEHGVSRMTVRQALVDLQRAGQVYSRIGKGTFVAPAKIHQQLRVVTGFSDEMRALGKQPSSRVLVATMRAADIGPAAVLGLRTHDPVIHLKRLRLADDVPLAIETVTIPWAIAPGLLDHDFSAESLYEVLSTRYRLALITASQTIEAGLADAEELALLECVPPAAVLRMRRLSRTMDGRSVELVDSTYRGDQYQLHSALDSSSLGIASRVDVEAHHSTSPSSVNRPFP